MGTSGVTEVRGPYPKVDGSRKYWERLSDEERQHTIHLDMMEAEQLDLAYELTKGWGRYAKAVEAMFAGAENNFVQGGEQLRRMLDDGELVFLEPSEIHVARRLASLVQQGNDGSGIEYTVGTSVTEQQPTHDAYKAARAFFDANPADRPFLIRSMRYAGAHESVSVLGRTAEGARGEENTYSKWIGVSDLRLKLAYDGIVTASELVAGIEKRRNESFERAKIGVRISGLTLRDVDESKGMYSGKIVSQTDLHVIQSIGCGLGCIHAKERLNRMAMVGQNLSISYSDGRVKVAERTACAGIER